MTTTLDAYLASRFLGLEGELELLPNPETDQESAIRYFLSPRVDFKGTVYDRLPLGEGLPSWLKRIYYSYDYESVNVLVAISGDYFLVDCDSFLKVCEGCLPYLLDGMGAFSESRDCTCEPGEGLEAYVTSQGDPLQAQLTWYELSDELELYLRAGEPLQEACSEIFVYFAESFEACIPQDENDGIIDFVSTHNYSYLNYAVFNSGSPNSSVTTDDFCSQDFWPAYPDAIAAGVTYGNMGLPAAWSKYAVD